MSSPIPTPGAHLSAPYPPQTASLGGTPTKGVDIPATSVFLLPFLIGAIANMTIFQINKRAGHKFIMSGMLFGFCVSRVVTCCLRIAWAVHPHNIRLAIAATIFTAAGVIILIIVNLVFALRILRAHHPNWAWSKWFYLAFRIYIATILAMLVCLITANIQSFFTLNPAIHAHDRVLILIGTTYFAVAAFLPLPAIALRLLLPRQPSVDKFGQGRLRTKIRILFVTSFLLCLGASFRAGTTYVQPPVAKPRWYDSRACFYLFDFTVEIIVVYLSVIMRIDKRFHIPNGSMGPGSYSAGMKPAEKQDEDAAPPNSSRNILARINTEEEVYDDEPAGSSSDSNLPQKNVEGDLEAGSDAVTMVEMEDTTPRN
ncbi:hypothetical protein F5884DRAFT_387424 [Xylogone sp. PMI_703]|nr:hypothetical protein F5884DRAFT_387424 [Xylogone sp. PMI_703]